MFFRIYLSFQPCPLVKRVELHQSPVLASPGDDGPVLEHADAEDRPVVHLPQRLCHRVVPAPPHEDVPVGVPGEDVAREGEGQARHVLGLVPLVEQARLPAQCQRGGVQLPEVGVSLPDGHDDARLQRVELGGYHRLRGALGLGHLGAALAAGPVPHGHGVVRTLVHGHQEIAAVLDKSQYNCGNSASKLGVILERTALEKERHTTERSKSPMPRM